MQISHLLIIMLVLPVSSVYCERGFSAANDITTKLKNPLIAPSIDILLTFSIEGPSNKQFDFTRKYQIMWNLINIESLKYSLLYFLF